ncbi:MAG: hypothetical protein ACRD1X_15965 [Vicinamibacteria bacterium]
MLDERLLGVWRSDKRRTLRELRQFKGVAEKQIKPLRDRIFGRLIHGWERRYFKKFMDGDPLGNNQYSVLAKNDKSVAVMIEPDPDVPEEKDRILHIRFEGEDLYWFPVFFGSLKREWFRRVKGRRRKVRKK